jgi:hypothetical protein
LLFGISDTCLSDSCVSTAGVSEMNLQSVAAWVEANKLEPIDIDCTSAVMLKILEGKCKMNADEKAVMAMLYNAVKDRPGKLLGRDIHQLITTARTQPDEAILEQVYEQRLYAEQMISRPVMKAFKAMLRQNGLLG